ncbi:alanine--glyoxylate aminotransferase family protein [Nicoliella spurrieriana]|uniref:Alanine--glyoxylate aminotransferase family protein n=1 Tax=Nicoliella spurrieriana TaxID=2925830 RepID=A0A976RSF6_9LACO|nr:alanine--glyoxylate aminotransferase family protein [Nicoliella spurrieriana]UQS86920.1 alanine--glyoxylate aminotransferase family protein [Nicoliella spurrieriana]
MTLKINDRLIMTPGPTMVDPRVSQVASNKILGQFDPEFTKIMNENMELIRKSFQTKNQWAFPIDGSSRAGIEAVVSSLIKPGDKVLVPRFGRFGDLAIELATRAGGKVTVMDAEWGQVFDQADIIAKMHEVKPKAILVVHGETSTGRLQPVDQLGHAAKEAGVFTVVDCVASYMGVSIPVDEWELDAVIGGAQKSLSAPAGITPLTFNDRFAEEILKRKRVEEGVANDGSARSDDYVFSNYLDLTQLMDYWSPARLNHHTESTIMNYALHEALSIAVNEEGIQNRFANQFKHQHILKEALRKLGLTIFGDEEHEMPNMVAVEIPTGVDGDKFRATLLDEYGVEISSSFGPMQGKIWRIGLMGYVAQKYYVLRFLSIFTHVLKEYGVAVDETAMNEYLTEAYK